MKKGIYILIALLGLFTSCSQNVLEIPQKSVDDLDAYIAAADEDAVMKLTASIYYGIHNFYNRPWFLVANEITGDNYTGGSDIADHPYHVQFSTHAITADNGQLQESWNNLYNLIYRCNLIIDKLEGSEAYKQRAIAEAKACRAYAFYNLVMQWGNVPLVDHLLDPDEYEMANTPKEQVWAKVEQDLTEAAAVLPSKSGKNGQKAIGGRWTKEACLGFLAKAQLAQKKYAEASANLKKVIDSGLYELIPDYGKIMRLAGDYCNEYLFELDFHANNRTEAAAIRNDYYNYNGLRPSLINHPDELWNNSWGFLNVTKAFAIEAIAHDGNGPRRMANVVTYDEFIKNKATGDEGAIFTYTKRTPGINPANNWYGSDGYARLKGLTYTADKDPGNITESYAFSNANIPILRYADILLMYAECAANGAGDKALGLQYLNEVRARAGLAPAPALDMDNAEYGIKAERRFEFFFENAERWYDLLRWGDFVKEMGRILDKYGVGRYYPLMYADSKPGAWHVEYPYVIEWQKVDEHHTLLPIPYNELVNNKNLVQNPGY
ncbi:MAG: RagB/SusD family nutrient uptake outer membrane protein [Bacteroidales bacterium]|nr:RagB/SusD family nutrient uptake outer membrane protein [Bacteroidales bacterium]